MSHATVYRIPGVSVTFKYPNREFCFLSLDFRRGSCPYLCVCIYIRGRIYIHIYIIRAYIYIYIYI
jgi:hypothetical protein